jgi:hypothetical protein
VASELPIAGKSFPVILGKEVLPVLRTCVRL